MRLSEGYLAINGRIEKDQQKKLAGIVGFHLFLRIIILRRFRSRGRNLKTSGGVAYGKHVLL